jgi:hypothetical protein
VSALFVSAWLTRDASHGLIAFLWDKTFWPVFAITFVIANGLEVWRLRLSLPFP